MEPERLAALDDLVWQSVPISAAMGALARFGWDAEDAAVFGAEPAISALEAFLRGELTAADVTLWAESIESREDIAFDTRVEDQISELIFHLANPDVEGRLTSELATQYVRSLRELGSTPPEQ